MIAWTIFFLLQSVKAVTVFGLPDEGDDSKTVITITLPTQKAAALRQAAEKAGMSIGAYIDSVT